MRKLIFLALVFTLLTACGEQTVDSSPTISPTAPVPTTDANANTNAETASPTDMTEASGPNITVLDVCNMLPEAEVTAVIGSLREAPQAAEFVSGCTYLTEQGFIYTINILTLDRWEIMQAMLTDTTAVPDLGDEALLVEQSSDSILYVLVDGQAVVEVYNTTSDTAVSVQLAQLAIDHIP